MVSSTNSGNARSTLSMPCSSFRHGMMTVIRLPLYTPVVRLFACYDRLYYHEVDIRPAADLRGGMRGGPGFGPQRVRVADGQRPRPVSRKPSYPDAHFPGGGGSQ